MRHPDMTPGQTARLFEQAAQLQAQMPNVGKHDLLQFLFANDNGFSDAIAAAAEHTPAPSAADALAIGLVVGNGYIASSLPEVPVDIVVMIDQDRSVLEWQRFVGSLLLKNATAADFLEETRHEDRFPGLISRIVKIGRIEGMHGDIHKRFLDERKTLAGHHFLTDEQRYQACREAMAKTPFVYVNVDLTDPVVVAKVGEVLAGAGEITFLNATNVADYIPPSRPEEYDRYQEAMRTLPFHPEAFVAFSSFVFRAENGDPSITSPPVCYWASGLEEYLDSYTESRKWLPDYADPPSNLVWGRQPGVTISDEDYAQLMQQVPSTIIPSTRLI